MEIHLKKCCFFSQLASVTDMDPVVTYLAVPKICMESTGIRTLIYQMHQ